MSEVIEICRGVFQQSQIIGIGPLVDKIGRTDSTGTLISLSFALVLRSHTVTIDLGDFGIGKYESTDMFTHRDNAIKEYNYAKMKVIDIIKLRPAHEL